MGFSKKVRETVYAKYGGRCAYCGSKIKITDMQVDHFIPNRRKENDMHCANCGKPIEEEYYRCLDNHLQVKYFEDVDSKDNTFCSQECFCEALSVEHFYCEEGE